MYRELYQYLSLNQQLSIPGIGTFQIHREPAKTDFPNRVINPPVYSINLQQNEVTNSRHLFTWLADLLHITDREAVVRFNDFVFELKKLLASGSTIYWSGVGSLSKDLAGSVRLSPAPIAFEFEQPVSAEKVLREKAEHVVRVGEQEKTSAQMTEILAQPEVKRQTWWALALVVGILTVIFIGWYLSRHGVDSYGISNKQKLSPAINTSTYTELDNP